MNESETPRTDREIGLKGSQAEHAENKVDARFAKDLERELNKALAALKKLRKQHRDMLHGLGSRRF